MGLKTASKVSVFDTMDDEMHDAVTNLLLVVEDRIVFKVKRDNLFAWPGSKDQVLAYEKVMQHLITLVEGVIRLEHASENGVFTSDSAKARVLNSILKDVLGHTRADKPR